LPGSKFQTGILLNQLKIYQKPIRNWILKPGKIMYVLSNLFIVLYYILIIFAYIFIHITSINKILTGA